MSKELEELEELNYNLDLTKTTTYINHYYDIKQALQRLEVIDNAKPSEALEILYNNAKLDRDRIERGGVVTYAEEIEYNEGIKPYYDIVKQALLKAQALEGKIEILKEYRRDYLERLENLEKYSREQEKVLKIIKEKNVDLCILTDCDNVNEYNKSLGNLRPVEDRLTYEEFDLLKRYFK